MLEKSRGVLIFATNTKEVDYVSIAEANRHLIKKYLGLPTTIVAGENTNNRRFVDGEIVEWHNAGRCNAYDLSPYKQTLVLDGDYLVFDNNLLKILDTVKDYAIPNKNIYVNSDLTDDLGDFAISPMLWATVIAFNKTEKSKAMFECVKMIQNNYSYYCALYKLKSNNFRNDAAFTIADRLVNGYTDNPATKIPWPILTVSGKVNRIVIDDWIKVYNEQAYVLPKCNMHFHDKIYLQNNLEVFNA